jgi:ATPase subunit of ABC transporter with duplicated ATPase domains
LLDCDWILCVERPHPAVEVLPRIGLDGRRHRGGVRNARQIADIAGGLPKLPPEEIVSSLSGGQLLRAGLASVLGGPTAPSLLILDEPTNHLDIDSIEAVEAGLRAYDGALLVVSHDEAFLKAIGISRTVDLGRENN